MPATKDEIADTFWTLTERYGYRRTTVADTAGALRISKKTIYDHFRDKESLYRFSLERWSGAQRRRLEALLTEPTVRGRFEQAARIAFADAREASARRGSADASEPAEIVDRVNAKVFGPLIRDLIEEGNAAGEFRVSRPDLAASLCVAIGTEAVRRMLHVPGDSPEEYAIRAMLRVLDEGGEGVDG